MYFEVGPGLLARCHSSRRRKGTSVQPSANKNQASIVPFSRYLFSSSARLDREQAHIFVVPRLSHLFSPSLLPSFTSSRQHGHSGMGLPSLIPTSNQPPMAGFPSIACRRDLLNLRTPTGIRRLEADVAKDVGTSIEPVPGLRVTSSTDNRLESPWLSGYWPCVLVCLFAMQ